jgi:hypothetical protein
MGRLQTYLSILIMFDLLFVITGQICTSASSCSLTSIIFSMAVNPSLSSLSNWFTGLIGNAAALVAGAASIGTIAFLIARLTSSGISAQALFQGLANDSILFAATGIALSLIVGDFVAIFQYLASFSLIGALLSMSVMCTMYILTVLEWVRGMP